MGELGAAGAPKAPGTPGSTSSSPGAGGAGAPVVKCKLVFAGDCACGKTTLIKRYTTGQYNETYTPTGFDTYTANYEVSDHYTIQMSLWDTSGGSSYDKVRPISYSDADLVFICFSIGDPESLGNVVSKWYPEIRENCPNQPIILVGCKTDVRGDISTLHKLKKRDETLVTYDQGVKTAKTIDALVYTEISSKVSRRSVMDLIEMAAMSTAGIKSDRKNSTFKRRRSSLRRKRFSDIGDTKVHLRKEVAKSCVVM